MMTRYPILICSAVLPLLSCRGGGVVVDRDRAPVQVPDDTILPSDPAGRIEGSPSVSARGSYGYSIPLRVPPGRLGLQPSVSLEYDSHAGNGVLGVGWRLSSTSSVRRCGKTLSRDGEVDNVNYDNDDNFCLDGQKLVKVEDAELPESFSPPSEPYYGDYRTERESFTRVVAFGILEPTSWVAFDRDGRIRRFGGYGHAEMIGQRHGTYNNHTYAWLLERVEDRRGNAMVYQYRFDVSGSATRLLEQITYTVGTVAPYSTAPLRRVEFVYEGRKDQLDRWINGINLHVSERLAEVRMYAPDSAQLVRKYKLTYEESGRSKRSLLASLTMCDRADVCVAPTLFTYGQPSGPAVQYLRKEYVINHQMNRKHWSHVMVLDADGDGFDDIVYDRYEDNADPSAVHTEYEPVIRLSSGDRADPFAAGAIDLSSLFPHPSWKLDEGKWYGRFSQPIAGGIDVDGDGASEWFAFGQHGDLMSTGYRLYQWDTGQATFHELTSWLDNCSIDSLEDCAFQPLDFDGDGLTDIAAGHIEEPMEPTSWRIHTNQDGDNPRYAVPLAYLGAQMTDSVPRVAVTDWDGNGTQDLLSIGEEDQYKVIGVKQGQLYQTSEQPEDLAGSVLADINGDGLKDLVYPLGLVTEMPDPLPPKIGLNTGNGFDALYDPGPVDWPVVDGKSLGGQPRRNYTFRVADFNGDGRDDLLILHVDRDVVDGSPENYVFSNTMAAPVLWLSDGYGFYLNELTQPLDTTYSRDAGWLGTTLGDVDNDGTPEIIFIGPNLAFTGNVLCDVPPHTDKCLVPNALSLYVAFQPKAGEQYFDRLIEVTDGFGATEEITYRHHAKDGVADPSPVVTPVTGCAYPERCPTGGPPVVWKRTIQQPQGIADRVLEYGYDAARGDTRGRGNPGFSRVWVKDHTTGTTTSTTYDLSRVEYPGGVVAYPFAGLPKQRTTRVLQSGGARTTTDTYTYADQWLNGRYLVQTTQRDVSVVDFVTEMRHETTHYQYDSFGNATSVIRGVTGSYTDAVTTIYDNREADWLLGLPTRVVVTSTAPSSAVGERVTEFSYDPTGLLTSETVQPDSPIDYDTWLRTTYSLDGAGLVGSVAVEDAWGNSRTDFVNYDDSGVYVEATTNPMGHRTEFGHHDGIGRLAIVLDPNGVTREYKYDGFGRLRKVVAPDGADVEIEYQRIGGGPPMTVTRRLANGHEEATSYDLFGRPVGATWTMHDGTTAATSWIYDEAGRLQKRVLPHSTSQSTNFLVLYSYDNFNRRVSAQYPDGTSEYWSYPSYFEVEHTDRVGRVTRSTYSNAGEIVELRRWFGNTVSVTRYAYGPFVLPTTILPPDSFVDSSVQPVIMEYDALGRRTRIDDPNKGVLDDKYNAFGDLVEQLDANGNLRVFEYDTLGRMVARYSEDGTYQYKWDWGGNAIGKLVESQSADGVVTQLEYDSLGRLITQRVSDSQDTFEVTQSYDALGRQWRTYYPETPDNHQLVVRRDYGVTGRLERLVDETGARTLWALVSRDAEGRLTGDRRGDVIDTAMDYGPATGRLDRVHTVLSSSLTTLVDIDYLYYDDGRMKSRNYGAAGVLDEAEYDGLTRLTKWRTTRQGSTTHRTYGYDLAGRIEAVRDYVGINPSPVLELFYNYPANGQPKPHAAVTVGQYSYEYDAAGREARRWNDQGGGGAVVDRETTYNSFDLPLSVTTDSASVSFRYDAFGRRFRKDGEAQVTYVSNLYQRRGNAAGAIHRFFVYADVGLVARLDYDVANPGVFTAEYLVQDGLGSVAAVVDEVGNVIHRVFHTPFGSRIDAAGSSLNSSQLGDLTTGFTGHEHDDELGLINMGGRIYDPMHRRFLTPDPVLRGATDGAGTTRYSYVGNDPFNKIDPSGFEEEVVNVYETEGGYVIVSRDCGDSGEGCKTSQDSPSTPLDDDPWDDPWEQERRGGAPTAVRGGAVAATHESVDGGVSEWHRAVHGNGGAGGASGTQSPRDLTGFSGAGHSEEVMVPLTETERHSAMALLDVMTIVVSFGEVALVYGSRALASQAAWEVGDEVFATTTGVPVPVSYVRGRVGSTRTRSGSSAHSPNGKRDPKRAPSAADKRAIDKRDGGNCRYCGTTTTKTPGQPHTRNYDHAHPWSRGGRTSVDNLWTSCHYCNQLKGARTVEEYIEIHFLDAMGYR